MKKVIILISMLSFSCVDNAKKEKEEIIWTPVIIKKKYIENETTKDLLFSTGNWHSVNRIIVDTNNEIWENVDKNTFILCNEGDTLWVSNKGFNHLKISKKQ